MELMLLALVFLIMPSSGHDKCSSTNTTFQKNQRILLDLLIKNAPLHDGFYNSSVRNNSDQFYGASQCKPNISSYECANCLKLSIGSYDGCPEFPDMESISSVCTTKMSNKNIIGVWTNYSSARLVNQRFDDPLVFSKGFLMMQDLASTVPYQPLMYQATEIDVGVDEKRYGLAQCGRDLSKLNCQNCLEERLLRYRSFVENRTGWEILGSSCSMWYSDNKDMNVTTLTPSTLPSDSQFPPGTPSVTSGVQRCQGIGTGTSIRITTFIILLFAAHVFHLQ